MKIYLNLDDIVHNLRDDLLFRFKNWSEVYAYFESEDDFIQLIVSDEDPEDE